MKRVLLTGVILMSLTGAAGVAVADIDEIEKNIKQNRLDMENVISKTDSVYSRMYKIESVMDRYGDDMSFLDENIKDLEKKIEDSSGKVEKLKKDVGDLEDKIYSVLELVYELERADVITLLMNTTTFYDLIYWEGALRIVYEDYIINLAELESVRERYDKELRNLSSSKSNLDKLLVDRNNQQRKMKELLAIKEKEFKKLGEDRRELEIMLEQLDLEYQRAYNLTNTRTKKFGTGEYGWPVRNEYTITSPFGMRFHPILAENRMHTGVDIGAGFGVDVLCADDGVVSYVGWLGGYGHTVIVDHGEGLSTLYAHNQKLLVKQFQRVYKGDVVSEVGSTGLSTGPHLHFEIRVDGNPVDPLPLL